MRMLWVAALAVVGMVVLSRGVGAGDNEQIDPNVLVQRRELAAGVHPQLQALLDDWNANGTHPVRIGDNGGLRTDSLIQQAIAASGLSKATNLATTAHGRGAALDVWPVGFNPNASFASQPAMMALMQVFGEFAEARGYKWGGRWQIKFTPEQKAGLAPPGDWPHVEMPDWVALPYPPPNYETAVA